MVKQQNIIVVIQLLVVYPDLCKQRILNSYHKFLID